MRKLSPKLVSYIFVLALVFCFVHPAFTHGDEPRLEISVEQINPGGLVEVRGVGFDYEDQVSLSLIRLQIQIPLTEVTTDMEGIFTQSVVLPSDLPAGEYNFLARTEHHRVTSPTITVWGAAVENQEDSGIRDQSDVQLGPIPTFAPGVSSTPLPQTTTSETRQPQTIDMRLIYPILFGIGLLVLLGLRILQKR